MSDETRIIAGAPYVFAREHLKKPYHAQPVLLKLFPAICPTGCGLIYLAPAIDSDPLLPSPSFGAGNACPDCGRVPPRHKVASEPDEVEFVVKMAFGNVIATEFMRVVKTANVRQFLLTGSNAAAPSRARTEEPDR